MSRDSECLFFGFFSYSYVFLLQCSFKYQSMILHVASVIGKKELNSREANQKSVSFTSFDCLVMQWPFENKCQKCTQQIFLLRTNVTKLFRFCTDLKLLFTHQRNENFYIADVLRKISNANNLLHLSIVETKLSHLLEESIYRILY